MTALGGRAAEELIFGDVSTGPEGDIDLVTSLARQMVGRWGMSSAVGPMAVLPRDNEPGFFLGPEAPSERTRELLDAEVRRLIEECYEHALEQLSPAVLEAVRGVDVLIHDAQYSRDELRHGKQG